MKRTRHTHEQIVTKLREADAMRAAGRTVAQVVQALGASEATFHRWRSQCGGQSGGGQPGGEGRRFIRVDRPGG